MVRPGLTTERLTALFLLGVVLFMPPVLGVFNRAKLVFGVPLLALYLFAAWLLVIVLVARVVAAPAGGDDEEATPAGRPAAEPRPDEPPPGAA